MCKWNKIKKVKVKIPADLSSTGKTKWKHCGIDYCIANIVKALQKSKIDMRGSCCGHNKYFGDICLQDGRMLLIIPIADIGFSNSFQKEMKKIFNKYFKKGDKR